MNTASRRGGPRPRFVLYAALLTFIGFPLCSEAQQRGPQSGNVLCTTAPASDNSTRCASTAFVANAISGVGGTGTVTSVAMTGVAGILNVAGSPITTSGTLALSLPTQSANTVLAGPISGGAGTPVFRTLVAADVPGLGGAPLTSGNDTNVTLTLGGSPSTALLNAASVTAGWTGTLAAARLNANVVQGITNDTNVTGSIAAQNLTLGWTGTLAVARGGIGQGTLTNHAVLVGAITSPITQISVGGNNTVLQGAAAADPSFTANPSVSSLVLVGATAGSATLAAVANGGTWTMMLPSGGGSSGQVLQTDGTGTTSWATVTGTGTVTSITQGTGMNFSVTPCTTTCTINIATPVTAANGGTGNTTLTNHAVLLGQGTGATADTGAGTTGQCLVSAGASANPAFTGGCRVLLATLTCPNSGSNLCQDTASLTGTYNDYEIVIENLVPATNAVSCRLRLQVSGTFQTTGYNDQGVGSEGATVLAEGGTTFIGCSRSGASNVSSTASNGGVNATYRIYKPSSTSNLILVHGTTSYQNTNIPGQSIWTRGGSYGTSGNAVTGVQFSFSAGNITSGTVKIYGLL